MRHARRAGALGRVRGGRAVYLLMLGAFVAIAVAPSGAAARKTRHRHHHHHASFAHQLRSASAARARADRLLVRRAHAVRRCRESLPPHHCGSRRRALQRAGVRLSRRDLRLARLATRPPAGNPARAPGLRVLGGVLTWRRVPHARLYVIVRKVPGQGDQFLVTRRTSIRPPAVPGQTVSYSARAAVADSSWAPQVAIGYRPGASRRARKTAPTVRAAGRTLRWNRVGKVTTYVLVTSQPGKANRYSEVTGTHVTPPAVAATVNYSVRTAVRGSSWSLTATIPYGSTPPSAPPAAAGPSKMLVGLNAGNFGTSGVSDIKNAVGLVRLDSTVGGTTVRNFANAGVKVELDFSGPYTSAGVSALNAASWVSNALSWYAANCNPTSCPFVEVLNEPWWPRWWGTNADSQANADAYARILQGTWAAFHSRYGSGAPKLLAACENADWNNYWCSEWRNSSAVANASQYVDGVTVHPYGGTGNRAQSALGTRSEVTTAYAVSGKPVYVTEVGWPTATQCGPTGDSLQWSQADQATNITNFMEWARGLGYVAAAMYFNYRDFDSCDWYGIETQSGAHKPGYNALKAEAAK